MNTDEPNKKAGCEECVTPSLCEVFLAFLRLGSTAFGGPAMVAYIGEMVAKRRWLSRSSFQAGVAIAQSIPGATAMQTAAYAGLRARGVAGAAVAFVGFGLPAFVFMVVLSAVYKVAGNLPVSVSIFRGLQVIVIAIVARATITFGRNSVKCWQDAFLGLAATAFLVIGGSPILAILVAALAGICLYTKSHVHHERSNMQQSDRIPGVGRVVLAVLFITAIGLITLRFVNRQLYDIALVMMKVDVFAFGGGFASVPLMLHEVVHVRHWMSARTFLDGIALGQVTPGPIVITATFVGYQLAGIAGAAIGTVAIFIPSFLFLIMVVPYFDRLKANLVFQKALRGILASFVGLLLAVTVRFGLVVDWTFLSITLACGAFVALMLKVDILWVVLVGAGLSALILR